LWKLADLVEKNLLKLAKLESRNQGKTIKYARDSDLPFIVDNLCFFAGAARMLGGKAAAEYSGMGTSFVRREPIGVVGAIVPWNYPLYIAVWKIAPALAAGNTIVIKPASYTPLTLLEFAKLASKAGVPPGVLNVVTGPGEVVGGELAANKKVDMITLTGDTATGKRVIQAAASTVKKVHLELGGKAPMIVLPDCEVEFAAEGAVVGGFWNAGQDCTAVTRVFVHEKMHDALVKAMVGKARKFKLGNPLDERTDMGPLIGAKQCERVERYVAGAVRQGGKVAVGGKRKGMFFEPTILTHVRQDMQICQEEIFGPVICVLSYKTVAEAIEKANAVDYGLASSVYGKDIRQCMDVARQLDFGTVWINEHGILASEMPHGGFKQSGFGKDLSMYSLEEYTRLKHVYVDLVGKARKPWHYTVYGKK
jgi:betaine-aldehyde dehydrogenase